MKYTPTIGLEIHAELKTLTKMFCNSKNDPDETRPNTNICPVCMGHPGTLPVINKDAVRHVLKVGVAVGGALADFTEFDRKNYFYPDLPKGYQISQYKYPLISGGTIAGVLLTRIHLEEDTARSLHEKGGYSHVDFNRAGVPLMELVTEPVIRSADEVSFFARELQLLLRYLGASDANMEKGQMRVEANVSLSSGSGLGTKVEVKNLNSFKVVEKAIAYEVDRQTKLLEKGESVAQETRGWDETKNVTFSQREKEESHDYRYFPEPDLPKLVLSELPEFSKENLQKELPELPWQRRERLVRKFGLDEKHSEIFVRSNELNDFFAASLEDLETPKQRKLAANYITSDLIGALEGSVEKLAGLRAPFEKLIKMLDAGDVSSRGAKDILAMLVREGGDPKTLAEEKGLLQQSDESALGGIVKKVIEDNPSVVADYKGGKVEALQFLVGQGMKLSRGSANPAMLRDLLKKELG